MGRSYEDLLAWQKSVEFVVQIYGDTASFPKYELYGLCSQIRRAATSIPSNIAEGQARQTPRDFRHFLSIARGSLMEVETQLRIAFRLGYISRETEVGLRKQSAEIGRLLNGLMNAI